MQELQAHYDDMSEDAQRKNSSRSNVKKIFYKNDTIFIFEKSVKKLKGVFNVLDKYWVPLLE